jgi:DNA-binding response OmpR family regulator
MRFILMSYSCYIPANIHSAIRDQGPLKGLVIPLGPSLRMSASDKRTRLEFGDLYIDRRRFEVRIRNAEVRLTRKEFELLWILASESGRVFHRDELLEQVWGLDYYTHSRTVDVHITRLRRKIKAAAPDLLLIETIWGIGYRFKGPEVTC